MNLNQTYGVKRLNIYLVLCILLFMGLSAQAQKADSIITSASEQYETHSKFKVKMLGENYRKEWQQPLSVKVFRINEEHGGLVIVQKGGGQQTKSLRLEAKNGKQYVLRTIEKYAEGAIPQMIRKNFCSGFGARSDFSFTSLRSVRGSFSG
ncbi:hypothetical protein [Fulvivirga ligni]|uniref:hypothetical protein n=1 Tax=Fulvivirga ligni TaxID=2904246 RepID=UPI001F412149|nr:hypothetical protein [Fulvivirga ligni]UII22716.1 hypothetical protein LVD16_05690 [Fulvivirga ligni]